MDNNNKKNLPYEQRKQNVINEIITACKENDIEVVPILKAGIQDIAARVVYVDMQDPLQRKKFGLDEENSDSRILTN